MRTVELVAHRRNNAVSMKVISPKNRAWINNDRAGWKTIEHFDERLFAISISDASETRDSVTHANIDSDGNRIGYTAGAPSLLKPKITTMWATLKRTS